MSPKMVLYFPHLVLILMTIKIDFGEFANIPHGRLVTPSIDELKNITKPSPIVIPHITFGPSPQIIGGSPVIDANNYPFMVNILKMRVHWCGGSYIAPHWVLTAAHCLFDFQTCTRRLPLVVYTLVMGTTKTDDEEAPYRSAIYAIPHPEFHEYNNSCDIGLIALDKPFELSETINFASLPINFDTYEQKSCTVIGWGVTKSILLGFSNDLLKVTVRVVPEENCSAAYVEYPKFNMLFYDHRTICARNVVNGGRDACQGDSGGPLILDDKGIQIGIVSFGIGCENKIPGIYTNVFYHKQWIDEIVHE